MADINLTQVIHNVKEAYVDLTGDTDDITYGNISTKISEIQTGGSQNFDIVKNNIQPLFITFLSITEE